MMPIGNHLPAIHNGIPVLIVGFDATHGLCVLPDGKLQYIEHKELQTTWFFDAELNTWEQDTFTEETVETEAEVEAEVSETVEN